MKYDTDYFIPINNTKNVRNCQDMNIRIKKLMFSAMYIALVVVLARPGIGTFPIGRDAKITLQNLPIFVSAITLGPVYGELIAFCGLLLDQIISWGFMPTTFLWVLPQTIVAVICGILFERGIVKVNNTIRFWCCIISLNVLITLLNTIVQIIDYYITGYTHPISVLMQLPMRLIMSILTGIVFGALIPVIIDAIKKIH